MLTDTLPTEDSIRAFMPAGKLRAAINYGNPILAQRKAPDRLEGVSVSLARALAERLATELELIPFDTAAKAFSAVAAGECDLGFMAVDPVRGEQVQFTRPYVVIEGSYLVRTSSSFHNADDVDRLGINIAAGKNTAYDLHLKRELQHASLVYADRSTEAIELFLRGEADAAAGIRSPLEKVARERTDVRVTNGRFMAIQQAMATPKGRPFIDYLNVFLQEHISSGFIRQELDATGQSAANVASL